MVDLTTLTWSEISEIIEQLPLVERGEAKLKFIEALREKIDARREMPELRRTVERLKKKC